MYQRVTRVILPTTYLFWDHYYLRTVYYVLIFSLIVLLIFRLLLHNYLDFRCSWTIYLIRRLPSLDCGCIKNDPVRLLTAFVTNKLLTITLSKFDRGEKTSYFTEIHVFLQETRPFWNNGKLQSFPESFMSFSAAACSQTGMFPVVKAARRCRDKNPRLQFSISRRKLHDFQGLNKE